MADIDRALLLESTLDSLSVGIIVIRADYSIVFMNAFADRFTCNDGTLRILNGRLMATDKRMTADLHTTIARCMAQTSTSRAATTMTLALPRARGNGVIVTVFCKPFRVLAGSSSPPHHLATVVLQDPDVSTQIPGDAFAQLYSLTQAELRVAMALIPGSTQNGAAEHLGISCNTVKTHLQRIFEKTSTSRQADLVALMLKATPPLIA